MKNYPKEVQQIHREFETAGEKLLNEAKRVLQECPAEKAKRLVACGFVNAKQAGEAERAMKAEEIFSLVLHYATRYPNNKFITKEHVEAICKKYNLVCGPVDAYTGFVPDEKLEAIENFNMRDEDLAREETRVTGSDKKLIIALILAFVSVAVVSGVIISLFSGKQSYSIFPIFPACVVAMLLCGPFERRFGRQFYTISPVRMICAPRKDMNVKGLKKSGVFFFHLKQVPDPVVLQPVRGGYLILAAWGDEASDEIVVNQGMN